MTDETFSVFIKPDSQGNEISYLHKEAFNMDRFGPRIVTRASEVEFDGPNQEWFAVLNNGVEIARDKSRDVVLAQERQVIDLMLSRGEEVPGVS